MCTLSMTGSKATFPDSEPNLEQVKATTQMTYSKRNRVRLMVIELMCAHGNFTWSLAFTEQPCPIRSFILSRSPLLAAPKKAYCRPCAENNAAFTTLWNTERTHHTAELRILCFMSFVVIQYIWSGVWCVMKRTLFTKALYKWGKSHCLVQALKSGFDSCAN